MHVNIDGYDLDELVKRESGLRLKIFERSDWSDFDIATAYGSAGLFVGALVSFLTAAAYGAMIDDFSLLEYSKNVGGVAGIVVGVLCGYKVHNDSIKLLEQEKIDVELSIGLYEIGENF